MGFPDGSAGKESACNAGDPGSIPGSGRSPGDGIGYPLQYFWGYPGGSVGKESACNVRDPGLIPGLGRSPGGGHGNPLQYSCLENPHGQRSLVGYSPWGHKRVRHDLAAKQVKVQVAQSCPALCDPVDYTVHGILQTRILEWVAFPFSRGSSQPRD